jgi:thiol-disulfide isomerase/thioredoxin
MQKITVSILVILFICGCYGKEPPKVKTGKEGQLMPVIDLKLIDSNMHFSTNNIPKGKPSILFSFEPWCAFCKAQTKSILKNIESFKDVNLYFMTNSSYPEFKKFYDRFELQKYPGIKAGIDYQYIFAQYFKTTQVPYMAIYDKDRKLKQVLMGKNYVSVIRKAVLN